MLLALGAAAMAQADVLSLLKQGMAARQRGDDDAAIYYLSAAIAAGVLRPNDLATVLASRGSRTITKAKPTRRLPISLPRSS